MNSRTQISVLLIDDDPKERHLIQNMLAQAEETDFHLESANRLSEGLARLGEDEFDAVLLDFSLPDRQWPGTLVKVHDKAPDMPVVVLRDSSDGPTAEMLSMGAQDCVPKERISSTLLAHCLIHAVERSAVEKESRYGDRRFRALIEKSDDAIAVVDAGGTIVYGSPSLRSLFGYEEWENFGFSSFEFIHPDDLTQSIEIFTGVAAKPGSTASSELRVKHKDGSWHYVDVIAANHLNNPAVGGIVTNFRDITERKIAEAKYRHEMEFYKRLMEHAVAGVMVVALDGTLLYLNPASERISGIKPEALSGQTAFDRMHPDDLPGLLTAFAEIMSKPGSSARVEARFLTPEGSYHWIQAAGTNCLDDAVMRGAVITYRDMHQYKTTQEALKKSQQELKEAVSKLRQVLDERSTPVIQIWNNVLALPLIGAIDDQRAQQMMELLLTRIVQTQSELVIVDVTGVPNMDSMVTNHLIKTNEVRVYAGGAVRTHRHKTRGRPLSDPARSRPLQDSNQEGHCGGPTVGSGMDGGPE